MNYLKTISAIGYSFVSLIGFTMGIFYTLAPKIMPYHLEAMGITWDNLNNGTQWMTLNYQRSAAAGFITTSLTIFFLLIFPFRSGDFWSYFALFIIGISQWGNIALRTISVSNNTAANPPIWAILTLVILVTVSFITSIIYKINQ
jgi:hypothetical protein